MHLQTHPQCHIMVWSLAGVAPKAHVLIKFAHLWALSAMISGWLSLSVTLLMTQLSSTHAYNHVRYR